MDDGKIVELFLARDEDAIKYTAQKYGARLRSLSHDIVEDGMTAEECENDTYLEAWNSIPPHEPRTYLYAFLARIIRHISLNRCRDRDRLKRHAHICELSAEMEACIPSPADGTCRLDDIVLADAINKFLSSLDSRTRIIFVRRYWYLDSVSEIARRFAISQSNVKVTLFRCRNKLREHLKKEGYNL